MYKYLLSIDNGLTSTKAVIFGQDGREVSSALRKTEVENRNEFSEIDMELQWKNTALCIKQAIKKAAIDPARIIAVGNSGHGAGLYMLDSQGRPYRKAVTSMDARAAGLLNAWEKEGRSSYDRTYHPMWCGQAIPVLHWLKKYEVENYRKIHSFFAVKDWIKYRLTGKIATEYTDATNSGLVDIKGRCYDRGILELFDVQDVYEAAAPLYQSTGVVGQVTKEASEETGLQEGTPVTGGLFDVVACALGSGVYTDDRYSIIAGTWNINSMIETGLFRADTYTKCSLFADSEKYIYVESSATSAVNLEWFVDNIIRGFAPDGLTGGEIFGKIDEGVAKLRPDEAELLYLPFLHKSSLVKKVDGGFLGIKAGHSIFHLLRAVFEGVAFAHRKHLDNLQKAGMRRSKAVISGGAANSDIWCRIFADVLDMEIITTGSTQPGALGTAICTAVAMGLYRNFEEAVKAMVKEKNHYHPGPDSRIYKDKYEKFTETINKLDD